MRKVIAGALAIALGLLGFPAMGGQEGAYAQGTVNFDIDPEITGNSANTLGTVEDCVRVDGAGGFDQVADHTIDVVVQGGTLAPLLYDAWPTYDNNWINVLDAGTDALIKLPGAMDLTVDEHGGDGRKSSDGQLDAGAVHLFGAGTAGDGTILRIGLDINFNAGPTVVTFSINGPGGSPGYQSALSAPGNHPSTADTGMLAINEACSAPVGGIAELPDVSGSAGRSYVALAGLAAGALVALAAGGWYARRRWQR